MRTQMVVVIIAALLSGNVFAQEVDLFKLQEEESKKDDSTRILYTTATFKSSRLITGHSVETLGKGILDFRMSHRFGKFSEGWKELFGFDQAFFRLGFDYGISKRLMVGFGRSTTPKKEIDGFLKYKLLRQSSGPNAMPVTVDVLASLTFETSKNDSVKNPNFSDRFFYVYQLIVARKFNEKTSLQIMPTLIHRNIVSKVSQPNDNIAIGIGGRQKISRRVSLNAEYYYVLPNTKMPNTYNSLSIGVDIETGGHVFQLHFSNSQGLIEKGFIAETDGKWDKGNIHFGFNIGRVFTIGKRNKNNRMKVAEPT